MSQPVNEAILQDRIQGLSEDWTLTDDEEEMLNTISHRIGQHHPHSDVTMTDIERIVTSLSTDISFRSGFDRDELEDLLFNA